MTTDMTNMVMGTDTTMVDITTVDMVVVITMATATWADTMTTEVIMEDMGGIMGDMVDITEVTTKGPEYLYIY